MVHRTTPWICQVAHPLAALLLVGCAESTVATPELEMNLSNLCADESGVFRAVLRVTDGDVAVDVDPRRVRLALDIRSPGANWHPLDVVPGTPSIDLVVVADNSGSQQETLAAIQAASRSLAHQV